MTIIPLWNYAHLLKGSTSQSTSSGDDNVHVQNTMRMVEALVQANKQFEDDLSRINHGIYGGNTSRHLYEKNDSHLLKTISKQEKPIERL